MRTIKKMVLYFYTVWFNFFMLINSMLGLPAQTKKEIRIFKAVLDCFPKKEIKIFEWGSGFSTTYYGKYLKNKGVKFEWHTIDNNKTWHEKIKARVLKLDLANCIYLYLKEFIPFWQKPEWKGVPPRGGVFGPKSDNEKAYINFPKSLGKQFDIVIVDARFRRRCIQVAKDVLSPGGIVFLHDAHKEHYQVGLNEFQFSKFLPSGSWYPFQKGSNKIWIGSNEKLGELKV